MQIRPVDPSVPRLNSYKDRLISDLALAAAAFGVLLAAALTSWTISRLTPQPNGFARSVGVLLHYAEYVDYIYAYFATVLLLIGITLFIEPSDVGRFLRTRVFIPAVEIAEHMYCLALGVFVAQLASEFIGLLNSSAEAKPPAYLAFAVFLGGTGSAGLTAEFLRNDLDRLLDRLGKFRVPATIIIAIAVVIISLNDMVWNFKPTPLLHR